MFVSFMLETYTETVEQVSIECRNRKLNFSLCCVFDILKNILDILKKIKKVITLANHKGHRQFNKSNEPIRAHNKYK